jgi:hypothetical protein
MGSCRRLPAPGTSPVARNSRASGRAGRRGGRPPADQGPCPACSLGPSEPESSLAVADRCPASEAPRHLRPNTSKPGRFCVGKRRWAGAGWASGSAWPGSTSVTGPTVNGRYYGRVPSEPARRDSPIVSVCRPRVAGCVLSLLPRTGLATGQSGPGQPRHPHVAAGRWYIHSPRVSAWPPAPCLARVGITGHRYFGVPLARRKFLAAVRLSADNILGKPALTILMAWSSSNGAQPGNSSSSG